MIIRKPYAFLIKHFKLLHIILTVCMVYLIYRTSLMMNFLNEYITSSKISVGMTIIEPLYNWTVFLLPIFIFAIAVTMLVVMTIKHKPKTYYIVLIIGYVAIFAIYLYGYTVFESMEKTIVDMRTIKALRDILMYCLIAQTGFTGMTLVRGVGFDIKKFDFNRDLDELEISEEDSEEIEVQLNFDINDKKRKTKRFIRYAKYYIVEHKKIAYGIAGVIAFMFLISIASTFIDSTKISPEGKTFTMNGGFTIGVEKSYITNQDFRGNKLELGDTTLVVVNVKVKNNNRQINSLKTGAIELNIAGDTYYHTQEFDSELTDLGNVYKSQMLGQDFVNYLLVFRIPSNQVNSKMNLGFYNGNNVNYTRLSPKKLVETKVTKTSEKIGNKLEFKGSIMEGSELKVTSYEIRNRFALQYNYCTSRKKRCVKSYEYLSANTYNSNTDKTLMKIVADFKLSENVDSSKIKDIYSFMSAYMTIEYEINDKVKTQKTYLGSVKPTKVNVKNTYFIEVNQEIKIADKITLVFKIRDKEYRYALK